LGGKAAHAGTGNGVNQWQTATYAGR